MTDLTLNDGRTMPQLGMGTYQIPDAQVAAVVRNGLDLGFRLVDTASMYHNERGVGEGLKASDAWLTTKLWHDQHDDAEAALDASLALLGRDAVDLYLIHWPHPAGGKFVEAWGTLVKLRDAGKAKSIGVSNFLPEHLELLAEHSSITPAVNQIELHPRLQQHASREYARSRGIEIEAWSPLGQGTILDDPTIGKIAAAHGKSPAQIILRWHLEQGHTVLSKSVTPARMRDNAAIFDFALDTDESAAIAALNTDSRVGPDPVELN